MTSPTPSPAAPSPDTPALAEPTRADRQRRWPAQLALISLSTLLLTFSFTPYHLPYLAWVGLAPLLLAAALCRKTSAAMAWTFLWGLLFFSLNLRWLERATLVGFVLLTLVLSCFPAFAVAIAHGCNLLTPRLPTRRRLAPLDYAHPAFQLLALATTWTAFEWIRGNIFSGFPWLFLGHAQSPLIPMIQVADFSGVYGVSFWVVTLNALVALAIIYGKAHWRLLLPTAAAAAAIVLTTLVYGAQRISETPSLSSPGPRVLLVQPNHPHERGGRKLVTQETQVAFHLAKTREALQSTPADLVLWSETVMPGLNPESHAELRKFEPNPYPAQVHAQLQSLAREFKTNLLTGAYYVGGWTDNPAGKGRLATDIRNSAYLYDTTGNLTASRYDKIHLLPFAELLPLRNTIPMLYTVLEPIVPASIGYEITPGHLETLTVFSCSPASDPNTAWRFVTPICSEDSDAPLVSRMFRPTAGSTEKRADFIAGVINDGWFLGHTREQHLQCALFRAVENRAPIARVDNTGISTFVDSLGQIDPDHYLPPHTEGFTAKQLTLDRRTTFYSRHGDAFSVTLTSLTGLLVAVHLSRTLPRRNTPAPAQVQSR